MYKARLALMTTKRSLNELGILYEDTDEFKDLLEAIEEYEKLLPLKKELDKANEVINNNVVKHTLSSGIPIRKLKSGNLRKSRNENEELILSDLKLHKEDVRNVLKAISKDIHDRGEKHDFTKWDKVYFPQYLNTVKSWEKGKAFYSQDWFDIHTKLERHSIGTRQTVGMKPMRDVNLMDVIEYIADEIVEGKGRSGRARHVDIDKKVLESAFNNTVDLLKNSTFKSKKK